MSPAAAAFDALFRHEAGHFVHADGRVEELQVRAWQAPADPADLRLFVDRCAGPTLDVGCGPGRLVRALVERRVPVLGIDVAAQAVRLTRLRGGVSLQRDIFAPIPGEGRWSHVLLADGNVGIGGDPARLLARLSGVVHAAGTVAVEVDPHVTGVRQGYRRVRVAGGCSPTFPWADVGVEAISGVAALARLHVVDRAEAGGRHVVTLARTA